MNGNTNPDTRNEKEPDSYHTDSDGLSCMASVKVKQITHRTLSALGLILFLATITMTVAILVQKNQNSALRDDVLMLQQQIELLTLANRASVIQNSQRPIQFGPDFSLDHYERAMRMATQLRQQVKNLIDANRDPEVLGFPHLVQMEDAFFHKNYMHATRLAENLVFVYPHDLTSYQTLLTTYEETIYTCCESNELFDAVRLYTWMNGIQDRQTMVIDSEGEMTLYLNALDLQESIRVFLNNNTTECINSIEITTSSIAETWTEVPDSTLLSSAASLVLVASMLDRSDLVDHASYLVDAIELLSVPVPVEESTPDQLLEYLWFLNTIDHYDETTILAIQSIISRRVSIATERLVQSLHRQVQSSEGREWLWQNMGEVLYLAEILDDTYLDCVSNVTDTLRNDALSQAQLALDDYRSGAMDDHELRVSIALQVNSLEQLDNANASIYSLLSEMEQAIAEKQEYYIADRIEELRKAWPVDPRSILAELALLPQPTTLSTMSSMIRVSEDVQQAIAEADRQSFEDQIMSYNRWALAELINQSNAMKNCPRNQRDQTRISAANNLALINESLLTRAVRQYFDEVYTQAVGSLNEEQKLSVYRYWVTVSPLGLDEIP